MQWQTFCPMKAWVWISIQPGSCINEYKEGIGMLSLSIFKLCSPICFFGLNPLGCNKYFSLLIPHMWLSVQVVWHVKQICSLVIWFLLFIEYRKTCEHNEICSLLVNSLIFYSPWFRYFLFVFVCWIPTQGSSIFANLNSS